MNGHRESSNSKKIGLKSSAISKVLFNVAELNDVIALLLLNFSLIAPQT